MNAPSVEERNFYELLGVERDASEEQIRTSYKELARIFHPDSNFFTDIVDDKIECAEADTFKLITEAYHVLLDANKRLEYDRKLPPVLSDWGSDSHGSMSILKDGGWSAKSSGGTVDKVVRSRTFGVAQKRGPQFEQEIQAVPSVFELLHRRKGLLARFLEIFGF